LGATAALAACTLHGARLAPVSHLAYNEAVQSSEQRELLLNLVRLRYMDTPEFVAISSISSQMQFAANASLLGTIGDDAGDATRLIAPGVSVGYSESPTVTFSPLRGDEFTRRLVAPIELNTLHLLTRYGWSLERTLRLLVDEINGINNALPRESTTPQDIESIERFADLARRLQSLYARRLLKIDLTERWERIADPIPAAGVSVQDLLSASAAGHRYRYDAASSTYAFESRTRGYVLRVAQEAPVQSEIDAVLASLGLRAGRAAYEIGAPQASSESALTIRTRSVLGALAYAAQGVAVRQDEIDSGSAAPSALAEIQRPLLAVHNSLREPADAFIAVPYRGRWFYIEDRDLESKRTLGLLNSLVRLEIGAGGAQNVPVLTLPVAR
jgi:hypothetical protein